MSSVKLLFEIGHSAERKAKPSKHGFTHDWELFVKSHNDSNDLSQIVEKVVFNLHESFPKPKRVIKEPPYVVKESGYAGFELTIEIYLRNRDDPKKATFSYDLDLQPFKSEVREFFVNNISDDFKRKCIKAGCQVLGGSSDYKSKDYKASGSSASQEMKKPKRPEESKTKSYFEELFGDPIEKPSPKAVPNKKEEKLPPPPIPSSSSSHKDKEKSKHKHSPIVEPKDGGSSSKKSGDRSIPSSADKPKKDKSRDRERSEKKDKSAKRAQSPPASSSSSSRANLPSSSQTISAKLPQEYSKPAQPKQQIPVVEHQQQPQPTSTSTKKSSKKKNYEKDREKKESKKAVESPVTKKSVKEESSSKFENREKNFKPKASAAEITKPQPEVKKHENVEAERHKKHKKKDKSKEKEKKEKSSKSQPAPPPPPPAPIVVPAPTTSKSSSKFDKTHLSDNSSDSEADSPQTKHDVEPVTEYKPPVEPERHHVKGSREKSQKSTEKRKRPAEKEDRDSSATPPPSKSKKDPSPSPASNFNAKSTNNSKHVDTSSELKVTNEYLDELKDLKHKITTLKNNDHLQHVVRLIAATGCYEITKSTFDFDLVQLDKNTVQRLQEFFAN